MRRFCAPAAYPILDLPLLFQAMTARHRKIPGGLAALLLLAAQAAMGGPLLLFNGNIYTADSRLPRAQAVVVVGDRIAFVGSNAEAEKRAPAGSSRRDLRGLTVFPGLTDSHAHFDTVDPPERAFTVEGVASLAELKARLRAAAADGGPDEWLTGSGWTESRWSPPAFPTKADLDEAAPQRPVILWRIDGHGAVANSRALALAGIDRNTLDPPGGRVVKDDAGDPTGMLVDNAIDLVARLLPPPTEAQVSHALQVSAERGVRRGWTQVQLAGNDSAEVDLLCRLYARGNIKLRIYDAIGGPGEGVDELLKAGPASRFCGDRMALRGIKIFIDGALGSRGAALLEPYSDSPGNTGLLVNDPEKLMPLLTEALRRGVQVQMHAIGDRGNRIVLDLYERAFAEVPVKERAVAEPRWRIEHAQHLTAADIPRFAKLGVIASMQPSGATADLFFASSRLGPGRLAYSYAWRSLLDSGATVVAGTDEPVGQGDPIVEFHAAVTRRSAEGFADASWHLEQRVSREQALRMLSLWPAHAAFQEKERGSIEVGKLADFTVLSADLMIVPESEILATRVVMTIIGGEIVYVADR